MTTIPESFYRVSVKVLIQNEAGHFLLIREANGMWDLPGGGLDHDETAEEGIRREMQEEMGIEQSFIALHPRYFFTFINPKGLPAANVIYEAKIIHHHFTPSPECEAMQYFDPREIEGITVYPNIPVLVELLKKDEHR